MFVTYLGLSGVPFMMDVCGPNCQDAVKDYYGQMNIRLRKELDEKYEREIQEAIRIVKNNAVDISPETINAPAEEVQPFINYWPSTVTPRTRPNNRRRRHKCSIM